MENNLFQFATKELSQDAVLAWCVNAVNYDSSPIHKCGAALLQKLLGKDEFGCEQIKEVFVIRQYRRIDILVIVDFRNGEQILLIIEDKTDSSEHDNQLKRYAKELNDIITSENPTLKDYKKEYTIKKNAKIQIAYLKTGYITDLEEIRLSEIQTENKPVRIGLDELLDVFEKNPTTDETLNMFIRYLKNKQEERKVKEGYIAEGKFLKASESDFGQWQLLKALLPDRPKTEEAPVYRKENAEPVKYYCGYQYNGTSYGTPWTQYCFWLRVISDSREKAAGNVPYTESLFWRIDPGVISLRYYLEQAPRKMDPEQEQHLAQFRNPSNGIQKDMFQTAKIRKARYEFALLNLTLTDNMSLDALRDEMTGITSAYKNMGNGMKP